MAANVPIYFEQGGAKLVVGDGGTIEVQAGGTIDGAGSIDVPDGSITAAKLAADSVITEKILDDNVTQDKLADDSVGTDQIIDDAVTTDKILDANVTTAKMALVSVDATILADDAVTTDKILDDAVDADKLAADAVVTGSIVDGSVTKAKAKVFISANQTGTQTMIAHGLGVDPTAANVIISAIDTSGTDTPGVYSVVIATDATNISVTVTGGALVYRVLAWA